MTTNEIKKVAQKILSKRLAEGPSIEYKSSIKYKDAILKTLCAFANNIDENVENYLFIGVQEVNDSDSGEKAIPEMPIKGIEESLLETTENELRSLTAYIKPKVEFKIVIDKFEGRNFIVISLQNCFEGPYSTTEKAQNDKTIGLPVGVYIRENARTKLATKREKLYLLSKFERFNFCENYNELATVNDLNHDLIIEYLKEIKANPDFLAMTKEDLIRHLSMVSTLEEDDFRVKNWAVLMFTRNPSKFIPGAYVQFIRQIKTEDQMIGKDFYGPVWKQVRQAIDYFESSVYDCLTLRFRDKIEHEIVCNYPKVTFEELITNAILHKDYTVREPVRVHAYHKEITIVNLNRPIPPITPEMMNQGIQFDNRKYINEKLKECFHALKYIESYGSGIRRAKQELELNNSPNLKFREISSEDDYTLVSIYINDVFWNTVYGQFEREKVIDGEVVNRISSLTNIQVKILKVIKQDPEIKISEIHKKIGELSFEGIRKNVKKLKEHGFLEREGGTKKGIWKLLVNI
ncbi:RNA-binding domain-containing protein [Mycoplasma sp. Ms02]|uniref:RNA-binding domain-containing protein n=1 Tax=Mycoplasma sp. Ms02 TaxID=353851 RepID=UPI001C88E244|nr:RNA-binding domain-containing protein [Mycoplasma sp. Ms02]QZE12452.1 putative DNA binding domain-containing protein [Mycoplasma sp. Ms02]